MPHAHRSPVVHRDLDPGSVLVTVPAGETESSTVKLLDLGIARSLGEAGAATRTGALWQPP